MGWGGVCVNCHSGYRLYATGQLRTQGGRLGGVVPGVPALREAGTIGTSGNCGNRQRLGDRGRERGRYHLRHQSEEPAVGWFSNDNRKPVMTSEEKALRDRAEAAVVRGLQAVAAVREAGKALHTLKSRDLWRDTHDSWQEYVQGKFGITARRAHQLVEFSAFSDAVAEAIGTSGTAVTLSERALRPLADVPTEEVAATIAEAVEASGGGEPTPSAIRKAAAKRKAKSRKAKPAKPMTIRVGGAKVTITPTHPEPAFRGFRETLMAALEKLAQGDREAA